MVLSVADYQVIEQLHRENNTVLYRAQRGPGLETILIKTFHAEHPGAKDIMQLKCEYEVAKKAASRGALAPFGLEPIQNTWLLMLEDCGGETLEQFLARGRLQISLFLEIAMRMAEAVLQLHRKQILHKDLKPANILINQDWGILKITNFASASVLAGERLEIAQPDLLEGSLSYMSPEQTGRWNRPIDFRSDLYALGVIYYEMLTGRLPFVADTPANLIDQHLATQVVPPCELDSRVPEAISEIVMKCLAKNAEDRYQSASGIKHDLEMCLQQLQETGIIQPIAVGVFDRSEHFQIPDTLYGRGVELQELSDAFARTQVGAMGAVFVSGAAGVGKSSLVQELQRVVLKERGFFINGKFDQNGRVSYQGLWHALNEMIDLLLAEREASVGQWKERILQAVGPSVSVLLDVLPALERIVGAQPAWNDQLPLPERQQRFWLAVQNLLGVFATEEHPLVLFLDDLHWADPASLNLIEYLLADRSTPYLLLVGSYRDDEAFSATSRMSEILEKLRQADGALQEIALSPLQEGQIRRMIADMLGCSEERVSAVAHAVMEKTGGTPFFVKQLLRTLHGQGLLFVEGVNGAWKWDIDAIREMEVGSLQAFMASKIRRFPGSTQELLQAAACIGNTFDLEELHVVLGRDLASVARDLLRALEAGIVFSRGTAYKWLSVLSEGNIEAELLDGFQVEFQFAHDQLQQAAYDMLTTDQRQALHVKVGRWLCSANSTGGVNDRLLEGVSHMNEALDLITLPSDREVTAQLNLEAIQRSKITADYEQALLHSMIGISLLSRDCWESQYEAAFDLYRERFELEHLCGRGVQADKFYDLLLLKARTVSERFSVYKIKVMLCTYQNQMAEAVAVGREALKVFGFQGTLRLNRLSFWLRVQKLKRKLSLDNWEQIVSGARMATDPHLIAQMNMMALMGYPASCVDQDLYKALNLKVIENSLKYGFTEQSTEAFVGSAIAVIKELADYATADRLGKLGVTMEEVFAERMGGVAYRNLQSYASLVQCWTEHNRSVIQSLRTVAKRAMDAGDVQRAGVALVDLLQHQLYGGVSLAELKAELHKYQTTFHRGKSKRVMQEVNLLLGLIGDLQGTMAKAVDHDPSQQALYFYSKLLVQYLAHDYEGILRVRPCIVEESMSEESQFIYSLALSAIYHSAERSERTVYRKVMKDVQKVMKMRAALCADNFLHRSLLLDAEAARIGGRERVAMDLYDQAIAAAAKSGYTHHAAIANECAAQFYLGIGKGHLAATYLVAAHYGYLQWGAVVKARQLEQQYPTVLSVDGKSPASTRSGVQSMMKASRMISGEIVLDKLLKKLIEVIVEHTDTQKILLLLQNEEELGVVARKQSDSPDVEVFAPVPWLECTDLSPMVVQEVSRLHQAVVLQGAAGDDVFSKDSYIRDNQPKSLLCLPILNQGRMLGMIYLENNLTTHGFAAESLEVMNLLAAQVAVSIENAQLYQRQVRMNQAYGRFVPHQFLRLLKKKSILDVELGEHVEMEMTIMFADIRSFTAMSERMKPDENFHFLNDFLSRMEPLIKKHSGFIDKYIGDSIMALFDRGADDAVSASIAMLRELQLYNQERLEAGEWPIRIGIGANSGMLMLGTIGGYERMDSTVISDAVNAASRIESLTKTYQVPLLISEHTYARLSQPDNYCIRPVDRVRLRGKMEAVTLYEVYDADPADIRETKLKQKSLYNQAYEAYWSDQVEKARRLFVECLLMHPADSIVMMYLDRCQEE